MLIQWVMTRGLMTWKTSSAEKGESLLKRRDQALSSFTTGVTLVLGCRL